MAVFFTGKYYTVYLEKKPKIPNSHNDNQQISNMTWSLSLGPKSGVLHLGQQTPGEEDTDQLQKDII